MARISEYPDEGELVICTVRSVKNFGSFVSLDEYDGKEGFIHVAEVASGWVKYIRDYVREGQKIVCKVMRVDVQKGHVDLSLKQVNEHQRREKIQQWKNEQKADKLMEIVAERLKKTADDCFEEFGIPLIDAYGTLYSAFEQAVVDKDALKADGFKEKWIKIFAEVAEENITPPFVKIDGFVELINPQSDGVVHIKKALIEAEKSKETEIEVQYVGAPKYRILVNAPDYKIAEEELKNAAEKAIDYLVEHGGTGKFYRKEQS